MKRLAAGTASVVLLAGLPACGNDDHTTIQVFAAASLTDTFTELGEQFEAQHEGVTVQFNFAGSSDLAAQLQQGAPADVFASADEKNMAKVVNDNLIDGEPVLFAANTLQIVTPPDNPAGIKTLADLARDNVNLVICAPEVPCGVATHTAIATADLRLSPVSEESAVTDVLGKVTAGEADVGLVYVTEAIGAGERVHSIDFPAAEAALNLYPIGTGASSQAAHHAHAFVGFVTGPEGRAVLGDAGFRDPP